MTKETKKAIVRDLKFLYQEVFQNSPNKYFYSNLIRVDLNESEVIAFVDFSKADMIVKGNQNGYFYSLDSFYYLPFLAEELSKITKKRMFFRTDD